MFRSVGEPTPQGRIGTFSFTKLVVADLERAARFYHDVFGMEQVQRIQAEIAGDAIDEIILGTDGGPGLILLQWAARSAPDVGAVILGFTTSDASAVFARVLAAGGRVREPVRPVAEAGGLRVGFLEDPEGHLLEIVELS